MSAPFCVFGAAGYLGRHLCRELTSQGHSFKAVTRENWPEPGADLGNVIFTIGMNANFRGRPFETYDAHIGRLTHVLTRYRFRSLLYVSSTRVYLGAGSTREGAPLVVVPTLPDQIFNISKLAGEALCLSQDDAAFRIARLSNVYGEDDRSEVFLTAVFREALETGSVTFHTAPTSSKDYIHIDDAARALITIARAGTERIYNLAAGENTTNTEIARLLSAAGISCRFAPNAPSVRFPEIETSHLRALGIRPARLSDLLPTVFQGMAAGLRKSASYRH